jgi:hypothetical protein
MELVAHFLTDEVKNRVVHSFDRVVRKGT